MRQAKPISRPSLKCLKALFIEAILSSYRELRKRGVVRAYTVDVAAELEPKTLNQLLRGNLTFLELIECMAERRKLELPKHAQRKLGREQKTASLFFYLTRALQATDTAAGMFADIGFGTEANKDTNQALLKVNKRMHEEYKYKQEKHKLQRVTARLNLICQFRLLQGI